MDKSLKTATLQGEEQIEHLLGEEYEHEPVPAAARRSAFSVTMVWLGFPMIITGAMTGSLLVLGMGFKSALVAMIVGNIIMFAYVGALGLLGTKRGMNFALIASIVFGKNGYMLASACSRRYCSVGMRCRPASPARWSVRPSGSITSR
ncbi:MAG: cytosine permease [Bradyrhizobium sp.]